MNYFAAHAAGLKGKKGRQRLSRHKRLSIAASMCFGAALYVGHLFGALAGLMEMYKNGVEYFAARPGPVHASVTGARAPAQTTTVPHAKTVYSQRLEELRAAFLDVRLKLEKTKRADFAPLEAAFGIVKSLDPHNLNILYYEAEIARIEDSTDFTAHDCLILGERPAIEPEKLEHELFFRYLDKARPLIAKLTDKTMDGDACYDDETGVCLQRFAWINHVLANDFYQLGLHATEKVAAYGYFQRAARYAEAAKDYRTSPNGPVGFAQCTDTLTVQAKAEAKLHELQPAVVGKVD